MAFLIFINIFQTWQFNKGIILHSGMTADNYGLVFGRTIFSEIEKQQLAGIGQDTTFVLKDESKVQESRSCFL